MSIVKIVVSVLSLSLVTVCFAINRQDETMIISPVTIAISPMTISDAQPTRLNGKRKVADETFEQSKYPNTLGIGNLDTNVESADVLETHVDLDAHVESAHVLEMHVDLDTHVDSAHVSEMRASSFMSIETVPNLNSVNGRAIMHQGAVVHC